MSKRHIGPVGLLVERIGLSVLARHFKHTNLTTVSSWKSRNSIPIKYWPGLIEVAKSQGETIDEAMLVALHNTDKTEAA